MLKLCINIARSWALALSGIRAKAQLRGNTIKYFKITLNLTRKIMIEKETVLKVANLARLELTSQEQEQFTTQLSSIIDYFEQLSELDISKVEPTTRAIDISNITRNDDLLPTPDRQAILNCAPDQDGDFFKVPQILG